MNYQAIAKKTMIMKREIQERLKKYGHNPPIEMPSPPLQLKELRIVSVDPTAATAAKRGLDLIKDSLLNRRPQTIRRFCSVCGHLAKWNRKENDSGSGSEIAVYCNACKAHNSKSLEQMAATFPFLLLSQTVDLTKEKKKNL